MPVALRASNSKAQAKYNVTTEFPSLGLHAAAATGNVGLVEYALSRGQPVNSVVDGVLPLHAACAGGSQLHDVVVKKLIEHGADVNAPRLPRRYSNEKNRDTTQLIVGASGSTPLHFAAANGNTSTVKILLQCGALPDRPDKHGVTPEMVAQRNGWLECAELLKTYTRNVREKGRAASPPADGEPPIKKRLQVKRSVEHALHMLKPSPSQTFEIGKQHSSPPTLQEVSPPTEFPLGEYTFYSDPPKEVDYTTRRPSFPQAIMEHMHQDSFQSTHSDPSSSKCRRPSSAGTGADRAQTHPPSQVTSSHSATATPPLRKSSKISLLSIFKKSQPSSDITTSPEQSTSSLPIFDPYYSLSSPTSKSIPIPEKVHSDESSPSPRRAIDMHNMLAQQPGQVDLGTGGSPRGLGSALRSRRPSNSFRPQHLRDRSGSRSSATSNVINRSGTVFEDDFFVSSTSTPPQRPSILRAHERSSSSGVVRALRFDSPLGAEQSISSRLKSSSSTNSLGKNDRLGFTGPYPQSAPPFNTEFLPHHDTMKDDDEDEEYGKVIQSDIPSLIVSRPRQSSIAESDSSLSPIAEARPNFPFSISLPPPIVPERGRGESFSTIDSNPSTTSAGSGSGVGTAQSPPVSPRSGDSLPLRHNAGASPASLLSEPSDRSFSKRRSFAPKEIDIREISSHAQAEEMVQRAQQSILEMEHHTDEEGDSSGWTPLSVKLAAYGKTLAVERMLREERDRKLSEGSVAIDATSDGQPSVPLLTLPTAELTAEPPTLAAARNGVNRQSSLKTTSQRKPKVSGPRRPNTSSGAPERDRPDPVNLFYSERRLHHPSLSSDAALIATPRSPSPLPLANRAHSSRDATLSDDDLSRLHPIVRSHSPIDNYRADQDLLLSRTQTTPAEHSERNSNKLARMGLTTKNPEPPRPPAGRRFGALKSLFKGGKT